MSNPNGGLFLSHAIQNEETVVECDDLAEKLVDFELAYWDKEKNEAKSILSKIYRATPKNYEVITALSTLFFQLGEFGTAKELVEKAIDLDSSVPEGWIQLALVELNLENLDASVVAIDKSLEKFPSTEARKLKAKILYLKENHDKALVEFEKLSQENPRDIYLMQCTAICQYKTGKTDSAMNTYRHILELDPENQVAKGNIAAMSTLAKQDSPAENTHSVEDDPTLHKANASHQEGDIGAAIQEIEKAMKTQPSNPALYATLGSLEFQFGQTEKAVTHWRKAVQIEIPSFPEWRRVQGCSVVFSLPFQFLGWLPQYHLLGGLHLLCAALDHLPQSACFLQGCLVLLVWTWQQYCLLPLDSPDLTPKYVCKYSWQSLFYLFCTGKLQYIASGIYL
jgi:tetratricopeptide (TPR) repeat protein